MNSDNSTTLNSLEIEKARLLHQLRQATMIGDEAAERHILGQMSRLVKPEGPKMERTYYFAHDYDWKQDVEVPLVHGLLDQGDLALFHGEYGTRKSFAAIDLGFSLATGRLWYGKQTEQAKVLYIYGEGRHAKIQTRLEALCVHYGVPRTDLDLFAFCSGNMDICDLESVKQFCEETKSHVGHDFGLIFIDTLSRNMVGRKEDNEVYALAVEGAAFLRQEFGDPCVALVHHNARGTKHSRGGTVLPNAVDVSLSFSKMAKSGGVRATLMELDKLRDGPDEMEMILTPVPVSFIDPNGTERNTIVLEPSGAWAGPDQKDRDWYALHVKYWLDQGKKPSVAAFKEIVDSYTDAVQNWRKRMVAYNWLDEKFNPLHDEEGILAGGVA